MKTKSTLVMVSGLLFLVAASALAGCAPQEGTPVAPTTVASQERAGTDDRASKWTLAVEPLSTPAEAGSTSPQITVEGGHAILSWLEPTESHTTLKFAEWTG